MSQSCNESVVKKAALLADMHVRSLRQKMTLLQLTEESAKKLEVMLHVISQEMSISLCACNNKMAMVDVDDSSLSTGRLTAQVDWLGLRVGGHLALSLHSSYAPGELNGATP